MLLLAILRVAACLVLTMVPIRALATTEIDLDDTTDDNKDVVPLVEQEKQTPSKKKNKPLLSLFWRGRPSDFEQPDDDDDDDFSDDKEKIRKVLQKFYRLADPKFARISLANTRRFLPPNSQKDDPKTETTKNHPPDDNDDNNDALLPGTILEVYRPKRNDDDEDPNEEEDREDDEDDDDEDETIEWEDHAYELVEKMHEDLGEAPKHYMDFAYTSVMGPPPKAVPASGHALEPKRGRKNHKHTDGDSCRAVVPKELLSPSEGDDTTTIEQRRGKDFFEDKMTFFLSWWRWWLPFSNSDWWKNNGSTKEDYDMGETAFAGGSNGEVWRGHRICRRSGNRNSDDFHTFWKPSKTRNTDHDDNDDHDHDEERDADDGCDDKTPLVLKRLRVERGYLLLEAGLREIYFGKLISRVLEESKQDMYTVYVDHFFREVPRTSNRNSSRGFGGLQKINLNYQHRHSRVNDLELWIVYEDAGPSLRSYIYTPISSAADGGFVLHQHSKLWTKLRTFTSDGEEQETEDTSLEVRHKDDSLHQQRIHSQRKRADKKKKRTKKVGQLFMQKTLREILEAAAELHKRGIVHRDIKPSNVMCKSDVPLSDNLLESENLPNMHCRLGDFSSGWDRYTSDNLYTKGPTPGEQTDEYAPPESFVGPYWKPFDETKPQSFDSWSIGVLGLELLLGTPNVFSVDQRTSAVLTNHMNRAGATEDEIAYALYLAALSNFCIFVPSTDISKEDSWPLGHGDPLHKTAMVKESCTLQDFHRALRARDPLGIGFDSSTDLLLHLLWQLLAYDPKERITAEEALQHPYFISPDGTLDSLQKIPGFHNALESQMLDPRIDFHVEDDIKDFQCPKCGRIFHDWKSCHQHANLRKHAKFCTYNHTVLPSCINTHSMLPEHPTSGYCDLQGRRPTIEDFHSIHLHRDHQFYGLFDGHTGNLASKFAASELYTGLLHHLPGLKNIASGMDEIKMSVEWKDEVRTNVTKAFQQVHDRFLARIATMTSPIVEVGSAPKMDQSGTTATALIVTEHVLIAAVLGDSRGILASSKSTNDSPKWGNFPRVSAIPFSIDHVASNSAERALVIQRGGSVSMSGLPRVNGTLAITRSIGDANLAPVLSREPNVVAFDKSEIRDMCGDLGQPQDGDGDDEAYIPCFVILASDGLWDVMTNQEAVDMVVDVILNQKRNTGKLVAISSKVPQLLYEGGIGPFQEAAERLAVEAYVRGSTDNIGVCVVAIE